MNRTMQNTCDWVLSMLCEHKLKAKCKKSAFGLAELQYLGHIMKNSTISMDL